MNCQCTVANVGSGASSLSFATGSVRSFDTSYAVTRTDCCCAVTVESGEMSGVYDGSDWAFSNDFTGCAGMTFSITSAGQVQYLSDGTKGTGTIKFRARTIDS